MRKLLVTIVVAFAVAIVSAAPASPQSQRDVDGSAGIRSIDARDFPTVRVNAMFVGEKPPDSSISVRENGRIVSDINVVPLSQTATPTGIVLVIDTSGSMKAAGKLDRAKDAARRFIDGKQPTDSIAIVGFANEARVAVNFTSDAALLLAGIDGLQPAGETALWDGVRVGSSLFVERPDLLPYLVVLSDGADTVSKTSADQALAMASGVGAGVFTIAVTGGGESDVAALQRLADETGGTSVETTDSRRIDELFGKVQRALQNQYEITWTSEQEGPSIEVSVKLGAAVFNGTLTVNAAGTGSVTQPRAVGPGPAPGPLGSPSGKAIPAAAAAGAAAAFGAMVVLYVRRERPTLDIIDAYARGGAAAAVAVDTGERTFVPESVRRAVETTARLAGGTSVLTTLDRKLEAADVKLKAQEFVIFYGAGVVLLSAIAALSAGPLIGFAALILVALVPLAALNLLADRRQKLFLNQLPDALQLLASSLRAGYSLVQGLEAVANEIEDPMGRELRRAVLETRLGRDLEVALDETALRMQSPDFDWVVIAIRIQREVGGNLAELLNSVADTMVSRERLRREVSALTAEGRLSAVIVGALPVVVAMALYVMNPGYLEPLFATTVGKALVLGATILTCAGFVWMKKVITIDV